MNISSSKLTQQQAPFRVALIGGRKTGKTTLCASLAKCLIARSHGFSPHMIARFTDATGLDQLEALFALKFNAPNTLFRAQSTAFVRKIKIGIDFTSSKWTFFKRPAHHLSGYYAIEIDDLRDDFDLFGQFVASNATLETAEGQNPLTQFENSLVKANALIICQPAGQKLAPSESTGFIRLMSDIATGRYGSFDTIIIAFTKYERLFLKDGVKAFQQAINPNTILTTMRDTILNDHGLETGFRALNCHQADSPHLYAIPVSSFGFLRHNGAPNYDKLSGQPICVLEKAIEQARSQNPLEEAKAKQKVAGFSVPLNKKDIQETQPHPAKHWLPFLTADPFLTAISGIPSQFMIPFGEFLSALDHGLPLEQWRKTA